MISKRIMLIERLKILMEIHKSPSLKEADDKIQRLNTELVHYQQSEKLKELELRYKMSDNFKLELEMKKYDVKLRKLDLALEREKNRRKRTASDLTESDTDSDVDCSKSNGKAVKIIKKRKINSDSESDDHQNVSNNVIELVNQRMPLLCEISLTKSLV